MPIIDHQPMLGKPSCACPHAVVHWFARVASRGAVPSHLLRRSRLLALHAMTREAAPPSRARAPNLLRACVHPSGAETPPRCTCMMIGDPGSVDFLLLARATTGPGDGPGGSDRAGLRRAEQNSQRFPCSVFVTIDWPPHTHRDTTAVPSGDTEHAPYPYVRTPVVVRSSVKRERPGRPKHAPAAAGRLRPGRTANAPRARSTIYGRAGHARPGVPAAVCCAQVPTNPSARRLTSDFRSVAFWSPRTRAPHRAAQAPPPCWADRTHIDIVIVPPRSAAVFVRASADTTSTQVLTRFTGRRKKEASINVPWRLAPCARP